MPLRAAFTCLVLIAGCGRPSQPTTPTQPPPLDPARPTQPPGPDWFRDVTDGSGLHVTYRNDEEAKLFTILETYGGGVGLLDYDGDGRLDVFVTGGGHFVRPGMESLKGHPCRLFRNLGNFQFEDVTAKTGLNAVPWWYTHAVSVADYDRDGWPDLLVTGFGKVGLFRNDGGKRFVEVTEKVGLKDESWSTSAGWADLDGDGFPDLYVCHYGDWSPKNNPPCYSPADPSKRDCCAPPKFQPFAHAVYKNEKGERFREASAEMGATLRGRGLGVVLADLNADGKPDVYAANDMDFNFLYLNRGGKFEERAMIAGVAADERGRPEGSMGVDVGDFDGTGRASLWVTNYQGELHGLYRNIGKELFHHQTRASGVAALGQSYVGFGTAFTDLDNDGWEDIAIVNGHVLHHPVLGADVKQKPVLLRNTDRGGKRFFVIATDRGGPFFAKPEYGRGLAVGDLDDDGWPDLVASPTNSPVAVLRNVAVESGPGRWVGFKLVGKGNRCVVGSTVTVDTGTRTLTRFTKGGGSYLSSPDPRPHFGLGPDGAVKRVIVRWSWGGEQTWDGVEPGAYWELREGEPAAKKLPKP